MNATILVIHSSYGNPNENWLPWLKEKLEAEGHDVTIPTFPTPHNQELGKWVRIFENYKDKLNKNTILVGHSIGCAFILNILEKCDVKIPASFLVAGFIGPIGNEYFDIINKTFTERNFNWEKIKQNCKKFYCYHADNDPYVPLEKGKELAQNVDGKLTIVPNAGHFNKSAGYEQFDLLLNDIKTAITKDL